jgi:hypothetical protein
MSFSYYYISVDTITEDTIAKIAPKAWEAFKAAVKVVAVEHGLDADEIVACVGKEEIHSEQSYYDDEVIDAAILTTVIPALAVLEKAFAKATRGVTLSLGRADDDTLRGSDLCGDTIWYIGSHMQPTPAYKKFIKAHGEAHTQIWITGG